LRLNATGSTKRALIEAAGVFAVAFAFSFWVLSHRNGIAGVDGFYHFQIASLLIEYGPFVDIEWLPLTILGTNGTDHHWLLHVLIAPFTLIEDRWLGLLTATAFYAALVPAVLSVVGRKLGIPYAPLIALLAVVASNVMPFRLFMLRSQNIALVFMMLGLVAMLQKRYIAVAIVSMFFMYTYHGAVIMGVLSLIYISVNWWYERRWDWKMVLACALGLSIALLANPWYPENIDYLVFHLFFKALNPMVGSVVGKEWYAYPPMLLFTSSWLAHCVLAAGIAVLATSLWKGKLSRPKRDTTLFFFVTILFFLMYSRANKFAEFYVPFAVVSAGLMLRDAGAFPTAVRMKTLVVTAFAGVIVWRAWWFSTNQLIPINDGRKFEELVAYLDSSVPAGTLIFNSSWGDFVRLIWQSTAFRYVNGLDGNYLAGNKPELFNVWHRVAVGKSRHPAKAIREHFDTRWVMVSSAHTRLARQLASDATVELRYQDQSGFVFYLR